MAPIYSVGGGGEAELDRLVVDISVVHQHQGLRGLLDVDVLSFHLAFLATCQGAHLTISASTGSASLSVINFS